MRETRVCMITGVSTSEKIVCCQFQTPCDSKNQETKKIIQNSGMFKIIHINGKLNIIRNNGKLNIIQNNG